MEQFIPLKVLTGDAHQSHIMGGVVLTISVPLNAGKILMQALTQNIRFTLDGTDPATDRGFQLRAGEPPLLVYLCSKITLKFFREAAGAVLEYEYGE